MALADDIRDAARKKRLLIGTNSVIRAASAGHLHAVYLASNCPPRTRESLVRLSESLSIQELGENSTRLGEICGKPFLVLAVGIKK